jgi:NitT/TauT family transport system substrate-binding protein
MGHRSTSGLIRSTTTGLALALLVAFGAQAQAPRKTTLRLDWTALGYHAPFYLGAARGWYRDAGIDLQILEGKGSPNAATLAGNGSDDFAFADASTTARLITQGLPAQVVMGIFQRSTLSLFFPVGKGIAKPEDLRGNRIMLCPGDGLIQYLPAYLKAFGMGLDAVKTVTVDCSIKYSAMAQGQADAVASYGTAGKPLMQAVGIAEVGKFDYADAGIFLPAHGIVTSTAHVKNDAALVRHFVAATTQAWHEARAHPEAAVAALVAANPLQSGKEALLKDTLIASFAYLETPGIAGKPFGWQSPEEWAKAEAILIEYTNLAKPASIDAWYTNAFIGG